VYFGSAPKLKALATILCTCAFEARPFPTIAFFTRVAAYSTSGILAEAQAKQMTPLA
jgi:hypothetical protein